MSAHLLLYSAQLDELAVLLGRPRVLADVVVEVVVPPLAALLARPSGQMLRDDAAQALVPCSE